MYLTEEDAREKWCPFARVTSSESEPASINRGLPGDGRGPIGCIASECMAWRWEYGKYKPSRGWTQGYCGLAGKPED